jgi:recombination protein RecR
VSVSSKYLERLIEELGRLPSIGRKTAQRIAFHLLRSSREEAMSLAEAIVAVKEKVGFCAECGNYSEESPCALCADSERDAAVLCVVEQPVDVMAIERTGAYRGRYHVLGGALSPLEGTGPEDLRVRELLERVAGDQGREPVREVILATNPTVAGESTALYVSRLLAPHGVRVTRIARGVPVGSDLEYSDQMTLARAFEGRKDMD